VSAEFFFSSGFLEPLLTLGGYLLGSLMPAEWMFRLFKHASSQELGVKPGTFSVLKKVGFIPGVLCLIVDIAKGFFPAWLSLSKVSINLNWLPLIAISPVVGHNWPFLNWKKGGWGLAATGGALIGLGGVHALVGLFGLPFGLLFKKTPGLAIGAVAFAAVLVTFILVKMPWQVLVSAIAIMTLEIYRRFTGEKKEKQASLN
jgi:glycerol-3-phosphate acyltransferase PlsY